MLPLTDLSPLELHARKVAETATNWAAQQSGGRTPTWDELGWQEQVGLAGAALTHIALVRAQGMVPFGEVSQ